MSKKVLAEIFGLGSIIISEQVQGDDFITLAPNVDLEKLTDGDEKPLFVTVEVIHEGVSRNKNYYDRTAIKELYDQILAKKPNAYRGHIDIKDIASKNPEAKTIWIGAGLKEIDGKLALFAKGYVLPEEKKFRDYLKKAVAAGKRVPVSIYGLSKPVFDAVKKVYRATQLDLHSIDWAREFAEGVPSLSGTPLLTSEMSDYNNILKNNEMDYESLTLQDLSKNRPDLVQAIQADAQNKVVSEMATSLNVEADKLTETVKSQSDELSKAKNELSTLKRSQAELSLKGILQENISDEAVRSVVEHTIATKMNTVLSEMVQSEFDGEKLKEAVLAEMKTPEIKELLRTKTDVSVPPSPNKGALADQASNRLTKRVPRK